ncbi:MAG TPA: hypothetical protein VFI39_08960 [Gemmatimonadales bacterium]|nr:hypothetical protein [Gemmatimonadales bacterium]
MKTATRFTIAMLVSFPLATHHSPLAAQTSATIYNDGRILVRRTIAAAVPRGASVQHLPLGQLDPGSIFSLDNGVSVSGVRYDGATDDASLLRRAIGRTLVFRSGTMLRDTLSATVVSVAPFRLRLADGSIVTTPIGTPSYPAETGFLQPSLDLSVQSDAARRDLRLGYFATGGGGWQVSYQAVFSGGQARLSGAAVINGGQAALDSAEIQLLAGQVSVASPGMQGYAKATNFAMAAPARDEMRAVEQKVGEFHLYTLPGRVTVSPGVTTTSALFDPAVASYQKTYVVGGALPWWGGLEQDPNAADVPVQVTYVVKRPRKTDLGDRPLPAGIVRMFEPDSGGRLQLIGETNIDHTPAGEDLELNAGTAFDLTAKRVQLTWQTGRDSSLSRRFIRTYAIASYADTLRNAGTSEVTIDVYEMRAGEWSILASSVPAERLSSTKVRFRVKVPAAGQAILTYRIRAVW